MSSSAAGAGDPGDTRDPRLDRSGYTSRDTPYVKNSGKHGIYGLMPKHIRDYKLGPENKYREIPDKIRLQTYDGSEKGLNFRAWYEVFDNTYTLMGLDDGQKMIRLPSHLRGEALAYYYIVNRDARGNYHQLVESFKQRFGKRKTPIEAKRLLNCISQNEGEKYVAFAQRILTLAIDAFPDGNEQTLQKEAVEAILGGIGDKELALKVMNNNPRDVEECVTMLEETESNMQYLLDKQRRREEIIQSVGAHGHY